jgi:hypothetical protein
LRPVSWRIETGCASTSLRFGTRLATGLLDVVSFPATSEQARVLWNFVEDGRLKALPVRASQRRVVLEYLAARFDEGTDYAEADVNDLLGQFHEDYASLRRCLVDEGLLTELQVSTDARRPLGDQRQPRQARARGR